MELVQLNEIDPGAGKLVDPKVGVRDMFSIMRTTLSLFKTLTHFNLSWSLKTYVFWWYPTFRPMHEPPMRFTLCMGDQLHSPQKQCLLQFILYMKRDIVIMYVTFMWN
jgi:hypothetical protein